MLGSCLISTFWNNLLKDVWCRISEDINHVSEVEMCIRTSSPSTLSLISTDKSECVAMFRLASVSHNIAKNNSLLRKLQEKVEKPCGLRKKLELEVSLSYYITLHLSWFVWDRQWTSPLLDTEQASWSKLINFTRQEGIAVNENLRMRHVARCTAWKLSQRTQWKLCLAKTEKVWQARR